MRTLGTFFKDERGLFISGMTRTQASSFLRTNEELEEWFAEKTQYGHKYFWKARTKEIQKTRVGHQEDKKTQRPWVE